MVAYRSFRPFFPLMEEEQSNAVKLWAVWAINHVCSKNVERYCKMFMEQGGDGVLYSLLNTADKNFDTQVEALARNIALTLEKNGFVDESFLTGGGAEALSD